MSEYTRITVPLSQAEFVALRDKAEREYRHPRDHARYLLREALGLPVVNIQPQPNTNRGAMDSDAQRTTIAE